jgi:hypothetical protein
MNAVEVFAGAAEDEAPQRRCNRVSCDRLLVRKRGEAPSYFAKRKYCSRECSHACSPYRTSHSEPKREA